MSPKQPLRTPEEARDYLYNLGLDSRRYRQIVPLPVQMFEAMHFETASDWYIRSAAAPGVYLEELEELLPSLLLEPGHIKGVAEQCLAKAKEFKERGELEKASDEYVGAAQILPIADMGHMAAESAQRALEIMPSDYSEEVRKQMEGIARGPLAEG